MKEVFLIGNSEKIKYKLNEEDNILSQILNFLSNKYELEESKIQLIYSGEKIKKNKKIIFEENDEIYFIIDGNNLLFD